MTLLVGTPDLSDHHAKFSERRQYGSEDMFSMTED